MLGVYTNTGMVDAYRGAGRPEATYVVERAVDLVARELDLDPVEVRRQQLHPARRVPLRPRGHPHRAQVRHAATTRRRSTARSRSSTTRASAREQEQARKEGRYLGIGFSTYVEICGVAPSAWIGAVGEGWGASMWESANVRVHLTGKVVVTIGTKPQGQGHETTMSQIVASELGIPIEDVTVEHGDTHGIAVRLRHVRQPQRRRRRHRRLQQRSSASRRRRGGSARTCSRPTSRTSSSRTGKAFVKGSPDTAKTFQEIAGAAALAYDLPEGEEPFLDDTTYYDPPNCTFPFGTHIAVVEIDPETGEVKLERYVAVDDVGKVINPMIVDGQVHGGIAQGIAQALWEAGVYDEDGQLQTSSLMDYAVPKADFFPPFELDRTETPTDVNPLGVKGAGETGTIASTPAVVNAVVDALAPLGITHLDMPLTPERVWRAMRAGERGRGGLMYTMRPAEFEYHRPASVDEALDLLASVDGREAARRRAQPPAADEDAADHAGGARRPRPASRASTGSRGTATSRSARSRRTPRSRRSEVGDRDRARHPRGGVADRRPPGAEPRHDRRQRRPRRPGADYPTVLKALGATIVVTGKGGERELAADDFFVDVFTTALEPGELVTSVRVPGTNGRGAAYVKHRHPASSYAVVGVAAVVGVDGGSCTEARLVVGGATGTPVAVDVEDALVGKPVSAESAAAAAERVGDALGEPLGDQYASGEYRVHLAGVLAGRAVELAAERASG